MMMMMERTMKVMMMTTRKVMMMMDWHLFHLPGNLITVDVWLLGLGGKTKVSSHIYNCVSQQVRGWSSLKKMCFIYILILVPCWWMSLKN